VELDAGKRTTVAQFAYLLEEADTGKISDICWEGDDTLLVIEKGGENDEEWKRLYRVHLQAATNLQRLPSAISGPGGRLESLSAQELAVNGVAPVRKALQLELGALGLKDEKYEGIDRVDDKFIALITDNDFGLAGGLDHDNALAETKNENPALYFVPLLKA
jgi:3-phytase